VAKVAVRPPVVTVKDLATGACMLKRGSGPSRRLMTVPSASAVVRLPSVPSSSSVVVPSGSVNLMLMGLQ
jgi:hypothetical protein